VIEPVCRGWRSTACTVVMCPQELRVESLAQDGEVQVGDRAGTVAAADGDDQPVDGADRVGNGGDRVRVAAVGAVADQRRTAILAGLLTVDDQV
jgi:hypothetical protein